MKKKKWLNASTNKNQERYFTKKRRILAVVMVAALMISTMCYINTFASQDVYITATGSKYHSSRSCRALLRSNTVRRISYSQAINAGYEPCSICVGSTGSQTQSSVNKPSNKPKPTPKLSKKKLTIYLEKTKRIKVKNYKGKISYYSNNQKVASVSTNGRVTAHQIGKTSITVKAGKKRLKCKIVVPAPKITEKCKLYMGKTKKIRVMRNGAKVKWSCGEKNVKIVRKNNTYVTIEGEKGGKATIKALIKGKTYKCFITVIEKQQKNGFDEKKAESLKVKKFNFLLPKYWDVDEKKSTSLQAYAERSGKVSMFSIYALKDDEDPVTFNILKDETKKGLMQKSVEKDYGFDKCKCKSAHECKFGDTKGYLYKARFKLKNVEGDFWLYCFPSEEDSRWFYVSLIQTDNTKYSYTNDFIKILESITKN